MSLTIVSTRITSAQVSVRHWITTPFSPSEANRRPPSRNETETTPSRVSLQHVFLLSGFRVPDADGPIFGTRRDVLPVRVR